VIPRTFSLARLLLAITLFCLLCGLAVAFPGEAFFAVIVSPPVIAWLVMLPFSNRRVALSVWSFLGAFIALFLLGLLPAIFDPIFFAAHESFPPWLGGGKSFLEGGLIVGIICLSLTSALGALLAGGAFLIVEHRRRTKNDRPPADAISPG
jgi:hypothetical protein